MVLGSHLETLKRKHTEIENRIREEESSYAEDDILVHQLKREKLYLKEEIERLSAQSKAA